MLLYINCRTIKGKMSHRSKKKSDVLKLVGLGAFNKHEPEHGLEPQSVNYLEHILSQMRT